MLTNLLQEAIAHVPLARLRTRVADVSPSRMSDWRQVLPVLSNGVLTLRELRTSDADALLELLTSEEVSRFISPPPTTVEGFERFIAWAHRERAAGRYICFAVVPDGMDTAIGIFQVRQLDPTFTTAEWGFAIGRPYWGSGVFAAAARLTIDFSFETVGIHRLEARAAALVDRAGRRAARESRLGLGGAFIALIHRPTACAQAGNHEEANVTTSEARKVRKGKDSMRFRQRQFTWQTAALVLAALIAFAVPVAAKPGPGNKLWSSKEGASKQRSGRQQRFEKLDKEMKSRSSRLLGTSKVILTINPGQEANAEKEIKKLGGRLGRRLRLVNGMAVELPNRVIKRISERSEVLGVHFDRPIAGHMNRTAVSVGARAAQQAWGYDGAGVGVAVIDSGITGWHDDLTYTGNKESVRVVAGQRVTAFVDFVNNQLQAYDDNGHSELVSCVDGCAWILAALHRPDHE